MFHGHGPYAINEIHGGILLLFEEEEKGSFEIRPGHMILVWTLVAVGGRRLKAFC